MKELTKEIAGALLENACDFQGKSHEARKRVMEIYREKEKLEENSLRILIDGLTAKLVKQLENKIKETNEKISYQISLSTSFVRTHYLINDLFMQGDLIEALTLIRKQMESITRLNEIDSKPLLKLHKKTPNVVNIFKKSGKQIYPRLSEVAHFGTPQVGELLKVIETGDLCGPSSLPAYHEYSLACLDLNCFMAIHFLHWFIDKLKEFYDDFDGIEEREILKHITLLAYKLDVIRLPEEEKV